MALTFTFTEDEAVTNGVKIMTYGPAGIGKTMLVPTLPRPVLISAESGLLSLSRANIERIWGRDTPGITYNIPVIKIETIEDLEEAFVYCTTSPDMEDFDSIALDSITEIMERILGHAKEVNKDPRAAYGDLATQGEKLIREFRDISGKHVYMSSKMAPFKDEMSGITKYGPMAPGSKLGPAIPYFFDELFAYREDLDGDGNTYRFLQTQPDLSFEGKDRSGSLSEREFPHLGDIIAKIQAGGDPVSDTSEEPASAN